MDGTILHEVKSHKHLGVTISDKLAWNAHIEGIIINASKCLDVLNALKYKLDRCTLEKLYFAFIRSKLEYASIVWDSCSKQLSDLVENVQYRAAKIVSGAIHRTSHALVYKELGWEHLEERRKKQRLKIFYKTIHGQTPSYLQEALPAQLGANNRYVLRNEHNIQQVKARTSTFIDSFVPKTIKDWNNLDNEIKASETIVTFAKHLNIDLTKSPKWYFSARRRLSVLHAP